MLFYFSPNSTNTEIYLKFVLLLKSTSSIMKHIPNFITSLNLACRICCSNLCILRRYGYCIMADTCRNDISIISTASQQGCLRPIRQSAKSSTALQMLSALVWHLP